MSKRVPSLLPALLAAAGLCASVAKAQPIGAVESPTPGQTVSGVVAVVGFVLDFNRVERVDLFVDGVFRNRAALNLPRIDVLEIFPSYANSPTSNPGFITSFNARALSGGPHLISVRVTETENARTFELGSLTVTVDATINQAPIGFVDVPGTDGVGANGSFPVIGWAIDDSGVVDHVDFLVDDQIVAGAVGNGQPSSAIYGTTRPDVFAAFPDVPNSLNSGFRANIDTTRLIDGVHIISVRAFDNQGESRVLGARTVQVINDGTNLPPFGVLDVPLDKASIRCTAPPDFLGPIPLSFYDNIVAGWALDVGSRLDKGQVSYVELLLDGQILANTRRDCLQISSILANCYGVNRPDVARAYPGYVNADNSGFEFLFALNQDPFTGLIEILMPGPFGQTRLAGFTFSGKHTLSIRAGDEKETVTQFAAISVNILCDTGPFFDRPAIGYIDTPSPYQFINGVFTFSGWAFDPDNGGRAAGINGITRIDIDIDGQVVGSIFPPFLSRPDVPAGDFRVPPAPGVTPQTSFAGWGFPFDTARLADSEHDLVVYVVDTPDARIGRPAFRSEIGRRKFVVFNNTTTK